MRFLYDCILFSLLRMVVVNIMRQGELVEEGEGGGEGGGAVGADAEEEIAGVGLADVGVGGRMGEGEVEVGERVGLARKACILADKHLLHKQLNATQFPFPTCVSPAASLLINSRCPHKALKHKRAPTGWHSHRVGAHFVLCQLSNGITVRHNRDSAAMWGAGLTIYRATAARVGGSDL